MEIDYKKVKEDLADQIGANERKRREEKQNDLMVGQRMASEAI